MDIGKNGSELIARYGRYIAEEARLINRLNELLREGNHDLAKVLSLSQEVFGAHAQSVSLYLRLQKYRHERNMGLRDEDETPDPPPII